MASYDTYQYRIVYLRGQNVRWIVQAKPSKKGMRPLSSILHEK